MTKLFVKKPYFILVAIVIVLTVGGVSLSKMQTDMLPEMELPYMAVVTTEIGASPEKVEKDVTSVLESTLGVISGVENITSTSANNYSMVLLELSEDTDLEVALVRVSKAINAVDLPDGCGTPNIIEANVDMMPTLSASVNCKGKDIKELSKLVENEIIPYLERQDGVASISSGGMLKDSIEIRLNQEKIDKVNNKILDAANDKLAEASEKISKAKKEIKNGKSKLEDGEKELKNKQEETNKKLSEAATQISKAQATKAAYEATANSLKASKSALQAEKKAYEKAKVKDNYNKINDAFDSFNKNFGTVADQAGIEIPKDIEDAVENKKKLEKFVDFVKGMGMGEQVSSLNYDALKKLYDIVKVRIPQIDTELANLDSKIMVADMTLKALNEKMDGLDDKQSELTAAGYSASAGFGAGQAQITSGKDQLKEAEKELDTAEEQLEESRKAVLENSNIDKLLTLDTLSAMINAQNFTMPAGYVDDKNEKQWLIQVDETFENKDELAKLVLTKIDKVGKIKVSDVADVVQLDNSEERYSKVNSTDAILLSIYKTSTANTSTVTKNIKKAFDELGKDYAGMDFHIMMNQGDYITTIIDSVLSSILLGAVLAIIVLALFLKDIKPTIIVAFSIPFSVLFAIVVMYFTGININVMSLAGLCLGIGMLVDNSIVVMENIYRLRNEGMSAAKAAVQGTKQVAGPIIASTITTICVFLPMVYTSGIVSQLLMPFTFTISYALCASLLVALTVVPALGSIMLKKTKPITQKWFESFKEVYGKFLASCLRHKWIPLGIAIILFVICTVQAFTSGLVMLDDMDSNQISVTLQLEDDVEKEDAYKTADKVMDIILSVDGISKVAAADSSNGMMSSVIGMSSEDGYKRFTYYIITDDDVKTVKQFRRVKRELEDKTKDIKCEELTVSGSALGGGASSMFGSGMTVNIYGKEQEELINISNDVMDMINEINGLENPTNGLDENSRLIKLDIDKNKAAEKGLTVAQIYQAIAKKATTDKSVVTLDIDNMDVEVKLIDEKDPLTYENLMDMEIETTTKNSEGEDEVKKYKLSKFATKSDGYTLENITRENQNRFLSVTAETKDGENTTLLSRKLQKKLDKYEVPDGYTVEIAGETTQVYEMLNQMILALALGFLLIYLVMVAQFQSLMSPFIIIFTVPLAFTGGMLGLKMFGQSISAMALMGFMILMGTVVNNGIVFVDYTNQLRRQGMKKREALVETGKTRLRPILMTALTTILSMSVMVFSQDAGNAMQKSMAIVVSVGLLYSTLMTLIIVPIMYDILYRHVPKNIDVGEV